MTTETVIANLSDVSWAGLGTLTLNGDVSGSSITGTVGVTVTGLQGRGVSATAPTSGQYLAWNSSTSLWTPTTASFLSNTLTSAYVFVGNASNVATGVAVSGDVAITNAGVTTVSSYNGGTAFGTFAGQSYASPPAIGGTTPAAGYFTTLSASSTVSGTGFSTYLASPPAIGGTAAAAGTFTTLVGTTINGNTWTTGTGTLTLGAGKTATISNTLTFTGTDGSTLAIGTGGTLGTGAYATIASYAALAGATFTGKVVTAATATGGAGFNLPPGTAPSSPTNGDLWTTSGGLYARINGATVGPYVASAGGITVGSTSISSGTSGYIEYNNGGTLGEYAISGTGSVAMTTSPTFTTPTLGAATATSLNGNTFTTGTYTLTGSAGKTFTFSNSLTLAGTDGTTMTFPGASATVMVLGATAQAFSGGVRITSYSGGTKSSGTFTPDQGNGPLQYITNGGAFTLAAPTTYDGSITILITNNSSAGTITLSGFTVGSNTGDALNTTNTNKFMFQIVTINGVSTYNIKALQ